MSTVQTVKIICDKCGTRFSSADDTMAEVRMVELSKSCGWIRLMLATGAEVDICAECIWKAQQRCSKGEVSA